MNALVLLAGLALSAQAAAPRVVREVSSSCRFSTADGPAEATFKAQYLVFDEDRGREENRIVSTLTLGGRSLPASFESCIIRRNGLFCAHGPYELRPHVVSDGPMKDKVVMTALVQRLSAEDMRAVGEGSCQ